MKRNYPPSKWVTLAAQSEAAKEDPFSTTKPVTAAPANIAAIPNTPITVTNQRSTYCVTCSALGRPHPTFFLPIPTVSLPHSNWSDSEEEEDWDGERQKGKECREKEQKEKNLKLKSQNNTEEEYYLKNPQYRPYSQFDVDKAILAPTFINICAGPREEARRRIAGNGRGHKG